MSNALHAFFGSHPLQRPVSRTAAFNSLSTLEISRYRQRGTSAAYFETFAYSEAVFHATSDAYFETFAYSEAVCTLRYTHTEEKKRKTTLRNGSTQ
jgi:hypothetical protein